MSRRCRPQYELDFAAMCHKLSGKSTDTSIREIIRDSQQLLASRPVEERTNKRTKLLESFRLKTSTPLKSRSRKQPLVNQTLDLESVIKDISVCAAKYSEDFFKPSVPLSVERRTTSSEEAKEKPAVIAPIPCPAAKSAPEIVSFEGVLYHFNDPIVIWINKLPDVSAERGNFVKRAKSIHSVQNGARISKTEDALVFPMDEVIKEDISNAKMVSVFESCDYSGEKPAGFSELNAPSCVVLEMVVLHVKRGPNSVFLFETTVDASVDETIPEISKIYNNVLKVKRISVEVDELCRHGPSLPPNMVGLLEEQLEELKLCDNACDPPKGTMQRKDPLLKRNGRAPVDSDAEMILKTKTEALNMLSPEQVEHNVCLTLRKTEIALEIISGALTVVYPAGLPEYDPIREELENRQDLRGSSDEQDILEPDTAELWFAGKQLQRGQAKKLSDYVGKIERSKAVVKLQRPGFGPPGMESGMSDDEKKQLMLHAYRRQEEMKRGPNSVFLFETTVVASVDETIPEIAKIYNNVLKVKRISVEVDELCRHGPSLPPNMVGLLEEQLEELKLCDNACDPPKGTMQRKDPLLKRNGRAPVDSDAEMILKTKTEALNMLSPEQVEHNVCLTLRKTEIALEIISGALTVVYPAGLPEYDPIREELENRQDLRGSSDEQDILEPDTAELWFAGKQLQRGQAKKLSDYVGKIERSKAVVKLQRPGFGPPGMESGLSDDEKKQLMLHAYRRQEEMKSLEASEELRHLGSKWADPQSLKRDLHGVTDVKFRPL
ncbi:unnamed protein product [Notodromas monacha]|uniref:Uncharacterized protein n=1 Tax=Notodromas monacha TaxID=399045 RepID=A0A7R9C057_9CRUS|nr:unnamed protein product [Notodromas monacha]CAG0923323.1 unnamed protein product [Notodromas monacha]